MSSHSSESESDNEAPEEFSLASSKKGIKDADKKLKDTEAKLAQAKKAKNRAADIKSKAAKGKGKEKVIIEEVVEEGEEDEDEEEEGMDSAFLSEEEEEESDEEDEEEQDSSEVAPSSNHLDPALFASAAAYYDQESSTGSTAKGKHDMKRRVRAEKKARALVAKERALTVKEGGARDIGDRTIQHLPTPSQTLPSLASTALPSHTSATKFLTNRIYSKKRAIAVLKINQPREEPSGRKRAKKGGMSDESKILLGIPLTGPSGKKGESAEDLEKNRKKSLLLQAEGRRKSVANSRPLASRKARGGPAANFAISSMKRVPERS